MSAPRAALIAALVIAFALPATALANGHGRNTVSRRHHATSPTTLRARQRVRTVQTGQRTTVPTQATPTTRPRSGKAGRVMGAVLRSALVSGIGSAILTTMVNGGDPSVSVAAGIGGAVIGGALTLVSSALRR